VVFRKPRLHQPRDAGQPLAAAARFVAGEIVEPGAGMGVDDAKGGRLVLQIGEMRTSTMCLMTSAKPPA
jgi:hypothetical protein